MQHLIGEFHISSGKMILSDPCYDDVDQLNNGQIDVLAGKWICYVQEIKNNSAPCQKIIYAVHEDALQNNITRKDILPLHFIYPTDFNLSVDSGQIGFYDSNHFHLCSDQLYDTICELVADSQHEAVTFGFGAASYTVHGDGTYSCFQAKKQGKTIGIMIPLE